MSFSLVARTLFHSITPKTPKISTLQFTTNIADEVLTLLQNNPNNPEKSLNSIKAKLDKRSISEVLNRCSLNNSQLGLRFFVWAGCHSKDRHSSYMYNKACQVFKIKQNPHAICDLIETYGRERSVVTVKMFKTVLVLCKESGLANEALWVLRKMPEFDIRPDTNAYNVVIRSFCDKGDMDMAQKLMGEMGLIDLFPDMITSVSIIKGLCDVGRLEEACELLKAMRKFGCCPNVVTYSTVLDGVCRFGTTERALELLAEMEKAGEDCSPNVVTYTIVIQSFCKKGMTADALRVLDRMEACGRVPNRVTVSTLIEGLFMDGHLEEAFKLIERVVAGGGVSYSDCYSSLVVCLLRNKKLEEAENLIKRVLSSGVKPDSLSCSIMIKELCLQERVLDGFCLYAEIEKMGVLSSIDSDIYSILLDGLCKQGYSVEAANLAKSMLEKRIQLQAPYIDNIVEQLKKFGNMELAKALASS